MNINWKLRFKNKLILTAICVQVVSIVYAFLSMCDYVPGIGENVIVNLVYMVIELLCMLGIVVDPTTDGASDSAQAMTYINPKKE